MYWKKSLCFALAIALSVCTFIFSVQPSVALASKLPASKTSSLEVRDIDFGKSWPLTVSSGVLECVAPERVIFRSGGKVYAVNGSAKTTGALPINPIWKDNPEIPGTKISISSLINRGLELCQ